MIKLSQLSNDMRTFYSKIGLRNIASIHQIQRVLHEERYDFTTVCQLAYFLEIPPTELLAQYSFRNEMPLKQHKHCTSPSAPIDWVLLDEENSGRLATLAKAIYSGNANSEGKPERVSERLIYRELGLKAHQLEKLPKCKAIFETYAESYPEYWARKIIWAYKRLAESNKGIIFWSDIRSLTGIKRINVESAIPFLSKHADIETTDKILKVINPN